MTTSEAAATGALVRGVRPRDLKSNSLIADSIVEGSLDDYEAGDAIVVGDRLARKHRLSVGDSLTLISPQGSATAFGTVPRFRAYRIVATFNIGMFEYDSSFIYMPLAVAQIYFRLPEAASARTSSAVAYST